MVQVRAEGPKAQEAARPGLGASALSGRVGLTCETSVIYPTEFLFLSNQFSNFPKTKRCAHEYNDNANQPIKPITITDHENQEQHQEQNQKLKDTESETKSR